MGIIDIHSRVGPDGKLTVALPSSMANTDVHVTVGPAAPTNGSATPHSRKPMSQDEWRRFIQSTAGTMPDFPDIDRPGPESYENRDWGS
jgi:hypothetical protein